MLDITNGINIKQYETKDCFYKSYNKSKLNQFHLLQPAKQLNKYKTMYVNFISFYSSYFHEETSNSNIWV